MSSNDSKHRTSRREAIHLLGTGLAAGPLLLVSGFADAQQTPPSVRPGPADPRAGKGAPPQLQDPRTEYPRPPFPAQRQPWPGLTSAMEPRPDHGETSYVGSGKLRGRKALITGGDSGIGRATAIAYAREGADVAIGYLPQEESDAREVLDLIRAAGRKAVAVPGDIRVEENCRRIVEQAQQGLGGIDILVNNAARQTARKSILEITTQQFDETMKTNLYATFWITKAAVPQMKPGSTIIITASTVAIEPPAELLDYAATKGGLITFTKALAKQLIERGIRVNAIAPGPYWTPLQPSGGMLPEKIPTFGADTPMGRPGQPVEIAPLFVALASDESSYTTGNVFSSTGGQGDV